MKRSAPPIKFPGCYDSMHDLHSWELNFLGKLCRLAFCTRDMCRSHFLLMKQSRVSDFEMSPARLFVWEVENAFSLGPASARALGFYLRHQLIGAHTASQHRLAGSRRGNRPAPRVYPSCIYIRGGIYTYIGTMGGTPSPQPCSPACKQHPFSAERHTGRAHTSSLAHSRAHYVILAQINRSTQASLAHSIRREHDDSRPNHCYYSRFVLSTFFVCLSSASGQLWCLRSFRLANMHFIAARLIAAARSSSLITNTFDAVLINKKCT